ncbi:unnamed protein product [Allacma fusca]|uniref:Protein kinase domain-containing protein n=1 Tax=Allacma fusca TaxID=39272 RepID=A0A8J2PEZ1_9HEXA|nr:unnamed protein product [Allacma fusca]
MTPRSLCILFRISSSNRQNGPEMGISKVPFPSRRLGRLTRLIKLIKLFKLTTRFVTKQYRLDSYILCTEDIDNFLKGTARTDTLSKPQSAVVLPYEVRLEVPRNKIKFEPTLLALLSELKIMSFVGKHANIVELVGANTERIRKQDVFLIYEFCENGNVLEYIRTRREDFVDQFSLCENANGAHNIVSEVEYENGISRKLCSEQFVQWAIEIATGMDFIASKNVYHGDLAARNILLTRGLIAKVGDFGLAKDLKDYALYVQRMNCPLPLKWIQYTISYSSAGRLYHGIDQLFLNSSKCSNMNWIYYRHVNVGSGRPWDTSVDSGAKLLLEQKFR